jgi:hypothetical protein
LLVFGFIFDRKSTAVSTRNIALTARSSGGGLRGYLKR